MLFITEVSKIEHDVQIIDHLKFDYVVKYAIQ
jgi:hypothetical protein